MMHDQVMCPCTYRICSVLGGVYLVSGMMHDQVMCPPIGFVQFLVCPLHYLCLKYLSCMSYTCPILNIVQEISLLVQCLLAQLGQYARLQLRAAQQGCEARTVLN